MTKLEGRLDRFKVGAEPEPEPKPNTFAGRVLAFDQTLTKTGWALLWANYGAITVLQTGMIEPVPEKRLWKAMVVFREARDLIGTSQPNVVVLEMPIGGAGAGARFSTESSTVAATAIACARESISSVTTRLQEIQPRTMKLHVVGDASAKKKQVADEMKRRFPRLRQDGHRANEDIYDALGLAVTYVEKYA